ncbi:FAD-dependent oxidoreductase [Kitasatospora aureofaciens]|uniref:FAD-dependent oxidoreductase n=1 Tax=Kitasatospora aureofaciens TaxID=1894 RepID=UPI0027E04A73|nr:FAD-dependent oxidoreductase [Kitasatospora aureofaciens]
MTDHDDTTGRDVSAYDATEFDATECDATECDATERDAADEVTVIGGGLAGMTAAWALSSLGLPVRLLEAAPDLGGKAGSRRIDGRTEDHGVHIFPAFYRNTLRLIDDLGLTGSLRPTHKFHQIRPGLLGGAPRKATATSVAEGLLFLYGVIDLLAQDYTTRDESLHDFLRTRRYLTEETVADIEHFFIASTAAESRAASAAEFRGSIAAFLRRPGRIRMPRGDLQHWLIDPFQRRLEATGVKVHTGYELTAVTTSGHRLHSLTLRTPAHTTTEHVTGHVVLAVPHGRVTDLGPELTGALRPAQGIRELNSRPLGALHLYLRRRLPHLPAEHIRLVGSPHAITLLDVGQNWAGHRTTVLNCVVGRVERLAHLPEAEAVAVLVEELRTYLPGLSPDDIEHVCYQPHLAAPYFTPGPGTERLRPHSTTALTNLHLAGDFCAAPPGMTGMEGAVRSGLSAAESVRRVLRPHLPPVRIDTIPTVRPGTARLVRAALAPLVAAARTQAGPRPRRRRA